MIVLFTLHFQYFFIHLININKYQDICRPDLMFVTKSKFVIVVKVTLPWVPETFQAWFPCYRRGLVRNACYFFTFSVSFIIL